jgi:hypothetical protein
MFSTALKLLSTVLSDVELEELQPRVGFVSETEVTDLLEAQDREVDENVQEHREELDVARPTLQTLYDGVIEASKGAHAERTRVGYKS